MVNYDFKRIQNSTEESAINAAALALVGEDFTTWSDENLQDTYNQMQETYEQYKAAERECIGIVTIRNKASVELRRRRLAATANT